jgi:hypothetical protein
VAPRTIIVGLAVVGMIATLVSGSPGSPRDAGEPSRHARGGHPGRAAEPQAAIVSALAVALGRSRCSSACSARGGWPARALSARASS